MEDYCFTELVKYLGEGEMPIGLGEVMELVVQLVVSQRLRH